MAGFFGRTLAAAVAMLACAYGQNPGPSAVLSAGAQALLDRARASNPGRYQYALDRGARILSTSDGRSFYLLWLPPGAPERGHPLIATLHGSSSWAFDEFFLWHQQAERFGYGILALQWWFGAGESSDSYYSPADLHRELREALRREGNREGTALLHGFSRGAANLYGLAALDRQSGDRLYAMALANAGGASRDFPPNVAISNGQCGYNVFSGTYWIMFCGGRDPNPDRDGCPAMLRTADWVGLHGGVVDLFIQDDGAGHGGFHQTPAHIRSALEAFRRNLSLRRNDAVLPGTVWQVRRDPQFEILNASIPNAGWVQGEVWLTVGGPGGMRLYRSRDGSGLSSPAALAGLSNALAGSGYGAGEVLPREDRDGNPALYVLGLGPPGVNRSALLRLTYAAGVGWSRDPAGPVFEGAPDDARFIGVPDVTPTHDGRLRVTYVARGATQSNSRTAISGDDGVTFNAEFNNPFGDLAVPNPQASDINVDPAVLRLAAGGYLAVTMRAARLYVYTSVDGRTFTPSEQPPIDASQLAPGATGLYDPTLVQLPDGRILMYVTAGAGPGGAGSRVVKAELIPSTAAQKSAPAIPPGGVRNAASMTEEIAPGSIIAIFGENLAESTWEARQYPLPLQVNGAAVNIAGRPCPLFYVSPSQINAQVPFETPPGAAEVEVGAARASVLVKAAAPGIFKLQGDLAALGTVSPGSAVTIYLTGQGAVAPPVETGAPAPASPHALVTQTVQATIGGKSCEVLYAGLAPGFAGLMQLNLRVPALPGGDHPVTVSIGQARSNTALIRVQGTFF